MEGKEDSCSRGRWKLKINTSDSPLLLISEGDRNVVRFQQTNLGRLIATAHMERAKADFAVMNSGGVRAHRATT